MHVGLSDMAIFRFARKASYGLFSAFGMYVGHYLAWVCAGVMGAAAAFVAQTPLSKLDSGDVASQALGVSGALAVVIAGWTTANPTLYRAGLAPPGHHAELAAVGRHPHRRGDHDGHGVLALRLHEAPRLRGHVRPAPHAGGGHRLVEHWIFPRIGLTRFWASGKGLTVSWPALIAWLGSVALAVVAWQSGWIHLFFLALPVWVLAAVVYTALSAVAGGARAAAAEAADAPPAAAPAAHAAAPAAGPRTAAWTVSALVTLATLASLLVLPLWVLRADLDQVASRLDAFKAVALALTALYFVAGTVWMNENERRRGRMAG